MSKTSKNDNLQATSIQLTCLPIFWTGNTSAPALSDVHDQIRNTLKMWVLRKEIILCNLSKCSGEHFGIVCLRELAIQLNGRLS